MLLDLLLFAGGYHFIHICHQFAAERPHFHQVHPEEQERIVRLLFQDRQNKKSTKKINPVATRTSREKTAGVRIISWLIRVACGRVAAI